MRIVVANLTSGGLSGGYRKYLRRLMPLLAGDPRVRSLTVLVPEAAALDLPVEVRRIPAAGGLQAFAREAARAAPDVVFVPTARRADFGPVPVVTMVRNMEPLTVPFGGNPWREGLRNLARAAEARRACRAARRVIAVSEYVRQFLVGRWKLDARRVGTVYHGVDPVSPAAREPGDGPPVLFTAGSIRPARGLEDAVRALRQLDGVRLVIAGGVDRAGRAYAARLRALVERERVAPRVVWAGPLDEAGMAREFQRCTAFLMTTRAEACPNTALEAMAWGLASVSVDRPPMPEFLEDAAEYYPPGDAAALAERLRALLGNPGARARLGAAARRRAGEFPWEATRDRTVRELEQALA